MLISLSAALLMLSAVDPDGVVSTAPKGAQQVPEASQGALEAALAGQSPSTTVETATPHGLTTAEQISRWISQSRSERDAAVLDEGLEPWAEVEPRRPHGQVSLGIGTGGYRDYAAAVELPLGETGTLNLSISETRNSPFAYGYPYGFYGPWHRFGAIEPPGFEGHHLRGRAVPLYRQFLPDGRSTEASVGIRLGQ